MINKSGYEKVTYGTSVYVENVKPKSRESDVLQYLCTGHAPDGRSLDGVTWDVVTGERLKKINKRNRRMFR